MEVTLDSNANSAEKLIYDFEKWQEEDKSELIFLLENVKGQDDTVILVLLLASEHEFKLHVPAGYPEHEGHFFVEADSIVKDWSTVLNQDLNYGSARMTLGEVLNKAVNLYIHHHSKRSPSTSEEELSDDVCSADDRMSEEEEDEEIILADDDAFTTEWDLKIARKKKKWAQKEAKIREEMKLTKESHLIGAVASSSSTSCVETVFTSTAAAGILTNDLVKIMEVQPGVGFTAEPIDDNIYHWRVKIFDFDPSSEVHEDLKLIEQNFGYNYIELEMTYQIDLYPFYPPLVKVMRPRLQGFMMQRVTNMELLKLSYWSPTKDMKSVILEIKSFLTQWARLEVESERNDMNKYPHGAYLEMEHHLLTLALVSEVVPRVNMKYQIDVNKMTELKNQPAMRDKRDPEKEYWAKGTGYGHHNRPEWDINAYLAAQKEKDNKIEHVLHQILEELKLLYANHAPQLKPRPQRQGEEGIEVDDTGQGIDPVYDMYTVLEGSALIPFIEQYLRADSFLEICRHSEVYKAIVDIVKELARQKQFLPLLCALPNQDTSVYQLLEQLEQRASIMLKHLNKAGNGSVPKPPVVKETSIDTPSTFTLLPKCFTRCRSSPSTLSSPPTSESEMAEEKLAREFAILFNYVKAMLELDGLMSNNTSSSSSDSSINQASVEEVKIETEQTVIQESQYKQALQNLQFSSCNIPTEGLYSHNYASDFKSTQNITQKQVLRIAQELSSLSTSLPLELSSSIFVRTDDEKLTLMRALITGPEGTPYSGGCYIFDIYFPPTYPQSPPHVNLQTTGAGKVRFNPNLYACGKVCLSLLGTWEGQKGEQWNEKTSTVLQVLVSIQSLILVPDPYFNEPGFEQEIGTDVGKKHSQEYNEDVCYNNIKYAMIGQLQTPPAEFADVIKTHFYWKKQRILEEVDGWVKTHGNKRLERLAQNLKQELKKLNVPPNVVS